MRKILLVLGVVLLSGCSVTIEETCYRYVDYEGEVRTTDGSCGNYRGQLYCENYGFEVLVYEYEKIDCEEMK